MFRSIPSSAARLIGVIVLGGSVFTYPLTTLAAAFDYHSVRGRLATESSQRERYEGETDFTLRGGARIQEMSGFGPGWSGDAHLLWPGKPGDSVKLSLTVDQSGHYQAAIRLTTAPDYGIFQVALDNKILKKEIDLYSDRVGLTESIPLGTVQLAKGSHDLTFTLTDSNPRAKNYRGSQYLLGFDYLQLSNLTPSKNKPDQKEAAPTETTSYPPLQFAQAKGLLEHHCYRCHGGDETKGKVDLTQHQDQSGFLTHLELTSRVADALQFHEMPPDDEPQLSLKDHSQLTHYFQSLINQSLSAASAVSPVAMRRMNRFEYNNAVRDLLNLKGDIYPLPEKVIREARAYFDPATGSFPRTVRAGNRTLGKNVIEKPILTGVAPFAMDLQAEHGFNNRGAQLSVPPILLESFLKLGNAIVHSPEFNGYSNDYESLFSVPSEASDQTISQWAKERLAPLLERAFRKPVTAATLIRYLRFFERSFRQSRSFSQAMKSVVTGILASPRFLYITETGGPNETVAPLSPYELATRLSFFLWSTIPDEALLRKARTGRLLDPDVLQQEVQRLLESPKSQALSTNFARQWLRLDQLITAVPDFERFERYYSRIGCEQWKFGLQTMIEPLLLFESIMVEDRSIMLLIDSNYAYRSDELQSWYEDSIPFENKPNRSRFNTNTQTFRRRPLTSRREGGVITTTAVLTMTSSPLRTSPINRGAWVASVIFNQPPPPPPDVVPEIEADDAAIEAKGLTLRQRLIEHQNNESCASCHSKIDPLGFALENFDAIGRWRETYGSGLPIDASGELFGQAKFNDIIGLKDAILEHPEWFIRAFSEHLLSYALGRELELTDKPAVDRIVRDAIADRGQFSTIVRAIALSYPFRHKTQVNEP